MQVPRILASLFLAVAVFTTSKAVSAFTISNGRSRAFTNVGALGKTSMPLPHTVLSMVSDEEKPAAPASGTYYDDEVEPPKKEGISDAMRQRLLREAQTGLDSDKKQTNVILYIMIAVAVLVIAGGQGILY